jgi:hypothetical protein
VKFIAKFKRFTDPSAESLIVGAGENAVPGEIFSVSHAASLELGGRARAARRDRTEQPHARRAARGAPPRRPARGPPLKDVQEVLIRRGRFSVVSRLTLLCL